jgi:hypothetical protein
LKTGRTINDSIFPDFAIFLNKNLIVDSNNRFTFTSKNTSAKINLSPDEDLIVDIEIDPITLCQVSFQFKKLKLNMSAPFDLTRAHFFAQFLISQNDPHPIITLLPTTN